MTSNNKPTEKNNISKKLRFTIYEYCFGLVSFEVPSRASLGLPSTLPQSCSPPATITEKELGHFLDEGSNKQRANTL